LGNLNALENEAEVPVYSQPVKKKTVEDTDNTYAQVNKTGTSASSSKTEKVWITIITLSFVFIII
jgi:hypothetical protein